MGSFGQAGSEAGSAKESAESPQFSSMAPVNYAAFAGILRSDIEMEAKAALGPA